MIIRNVLDSGKYGQRTDNEKGTVYIAFDSNQIKSVDNKNPTEHRDVRYKIPTKDADFSSDFDYSGLNWAKDLGIITSKDTAIFERTINNEILRGAKPNSANGEYIIDTGKCLMFTDGDFHNPALSCVVVFATEYESLTADAKELIYNDAKATGDIQKSIKAIEKMFGSGFTSLYDSGTGAANGGKNGRGKGINSSQYYRRNRPKSVKEILEQQGIKNFKLPVGDEESSPHDCEGSIAVFMHISVHGGIFIVSQITTAADGDRITEKCRFRLKDAHGKVLTSGQDLTHISACLTGIGLIIGRHTICLQTKLFRNIDSTV